MSNSTHSHGEKEALRRADPTPPLSGQQLREIESQTLSAYEERAEDFREGTRDHDVSQNVEALLGAIVGEPPFRILDFGCGPGRDLLNFRARGHEPVGLDGSLAFVEMARATGAGPVLHQSFLALDLAPGSFDGVFANASLFHVPAQELPRVLAALFACALRASSP